MKKIMIYFAIFTTFFTIFVIVTFNHFVLPIAIDLCNKYAVTKINSEINNATDKVVTQLDLKSSDFTEEISTTDLSHINIDSLLINSVANKIVYQISQNMNELSFDQIKVPIGAFSGIPLFSRLGFSVPIHISSIGDAQADYDTSLTSAGVNQVSYQIWLNIECNVSVVSPLYSQTLCIKRKLMLVNTIFNGKVPEGYANIQFK